LKALIKEHSLEVKVVKSMSDDDIRGAIAEAIGGDEEEEDEEPEEDEEEDDSVDLSSLNRTELKALIKENELEIRVTKSMTDDALRGAIATALGGDADAEEEEEEAEESSNGYTAMSIQQLKDALKERGLSTSGAKKVLVGRLEEDDKKGGDPF
jgi:hypothetical protein